MLYFRHHWVSRCVEGACVPRSQKVGVFSEARRTDFVIADSWIMLSGRDKQEAEHLLAFFCRSFGFIVTLGRHIGRPQEACILCVMRFFSLGVSLRKK